MKTLTILLSLVFVSNCFAGSVLIRKSDGVPIEYQSTDVSKETLMKNNPQYTEAEVEYRKITPRQYKVLHNNKITKPLRDSKRAQRQIAIDAVKTKLNLTDAQFKALVRAIRGE